MKIWQKIFNLSIWAQVPPCRVSMAFTLCCWVCSLLQYEYFVMLNFLPVSKHCNFFKKFFHKCFSVSNSLDLDQTCWVYHALFVIQEKATTASTAMAANSGGIRNAAGYNDWHQILIIGVHSARGLPALLTADHRVKFRSDLISSRW